MRRGVGLIAALLLAAGIVWLHRSGPAPEVASAAPVLQPGSVSIDDAGREHIDLATAEIVPASSEGTLAVIGRVLDPIPLVDAVLARDAAQAISEPARREVERVRELARDGQNASQRELETAETAWRRARLDLDAAQARLVANFGVELGERADLAALVSRVTTRRSALARVDLPAGVACPGPPAGVQLRMATGAARVVDATLLGEAPTTDPLLQARGWLALIEREPPAPGTALMGLLEVPALAGTGLRVPEDAVVRLDGGVFVYVERAHNAFERRAIQLESPLPGAWLATGAIAAGNRVVVQGAQSLLSAEHGAAHGGD